jgi:nucleoid-associated protein YgaU
MQGDRLYVTGKAPTEAAKNKVWDAIKKIDSAYPDLICDLDVAALADVQVHTVQAGDTLSKISLHYYGDAGQYMRIFDANRDQLDDPNGIKVGQRLLIPACS